jgi:NADH:ubiquinone oxidoreductase subunit 5 (subunit L)/multisubunit Na+/H+ antiporter MnhA subunit
MTVATAIGLLIFCGAVGKSGQVPLHVWLPDAMEGPTPVSALIHAATMVAAGVYLVARVYPLMSASALEVVAWVGAITAIFAACIAVAQNDIKRILAYSTVSQLGYMMLGLGVGGVAVGMFHLITHAFFKALLFLGAGSVIHGCTEEQDIRNMGGALSARDVRDVCVRHAGTVRVSIVCGILEQGRNSALRAWMGHFARTVLSGGHRRAADRVLYDAANVLRLLRTTAGNGSQC